jgi:hypothetical protein
MKNLPRISISACGHNIDQICNQPRSLGLLVGCKCTMDLLNNWKNKKMVLPFHQFERPNIEMSVLNVLIKNFLKVTYGNFLNPVYICESDVFVSRS